MQFLIAVCCLFFVYSGKITVNFRDMIRFVMETARKRFRSFYSFWFIFFILFQKNVVSLPTAKMHSAR